MSGKEKCKVLKDIRRDIARANEVELDIPECTHKGDCQGTCPRCEWEVRYLEKSLAERRRRGLKVALTGVFAGIVSLNAVSCDTDVFGIGRVEGDMQALDGDIAVYETLESDIAGELVEQGEIPADTGEIVVETLQGDIAFIPDEPEIMGGLLPPDDGLEQAK